MNLSGVKLTTHKAAHMLRENNRTMKFNVQFLSQFEVGFAYEAILAWAERKINYAGR